MGDRIRRASVWRHDGSSEAVELSQLAEVDGFCWIELACGPEDTGATLKTIEEHCPGLTEAMLEDLLTPDEQPDGRSYERDIRLASTFSVTPWRPKRHGERGTPHGVGVLRFQPIEILAGESWLLTCWHPQRIFQGSTKVDEQPPGEADELLKAVAARWKREPGEVPGDLGIS